MDDSKSKHNLVDLKQKIAKNQQKSQVLQDQKKEEALQIPPGAITNFVSMPTEKGEKHLPVPINQIVESIKNVENLIKIGDTFYLKNDGKILPLLEFDDLFSALQELGKFVFFKTSMGFTSKKEVFSALLRKAPDYTRISANPNFPKDQNIYYDCDDIEPLSTGALDELVAFFYPKTGYDKALIKALFVTPGWSNSTGKKPLFIIQSDPEMCGEKVNVGKTTLAKLVSRLYGGYIDLKPAMSEEKTAQAIVKLAHKQIILYDNVKTTAWSSALLEAMVTAENIQGHLMYRGAVSIPNHFTYIVTVNDPSVSTDLASRAVPISLAKPPSQDAAWQYHVENFVDENRVKLLQDIGHIILSENVRKDPATRFPIWEEVVLNKLIKEDVKAHIKAAQSQVNFENDTGWQDHLIDQMNEYTVGYQRIERMVEAFDPEELNWWFSSNILQRMYQEFAGLKNSRMGKHLASRVKAEMMKLTGWKVEEFRPYINNVKQPRGYLLTKTGAVGAQKFYAPFDIPNIDRQLRVFRG